MMRNFLTASAIIAVASAPAAAQTAQSSSTQRQTGSASDPLIGLTGEPVRDTDTNAIPKDAAPDRSPHVNARGRVTARQNASVVARVGARVGGQDPEPD